MLMQQALLHRHDTVIILAGYSDRIDELLECNPGLKSRFPVRVEFPDYSTEELMEIAKRMAPPKRICIGPEVLKTLRHHIDRAAPLQANARDVENLLAAAARKRDVRVRNIEGLSVEQLDSVTVADVEAAVPGVSAFFAPGAYERMCVPSRV